MSRNISKNSNCKNRNSSERKQQSKSSRSKAKGRSQNRDKQYAEEATNMESTATRERSGKQDFAWYNQYPALTASTCQIPFNNSVGIPVDANVGVVDTMAPEKSPRVNWTAPGIMSFAIVPTIGDATSKESAVNVASRALYTYVRHVNSGHANYDAPDLMMYLVAMDSLVMYHEYLKRIYGVLALNHPLNRYMPKGLCAAMGVDYDDMIAHMPNLLYYINSFATRVSSMVVPATIPLFERHKFMFSGYYADADNLKSQMYLFNPAILWKIDATQSTGTKLVPTEWIFDKDIPNTFDELVEIGNSLIDAIAWNEDFNIMSGDILKAFGADKIRKFETIDSKYYVLPTPLSDMPMFSDQISNMVIDGVQNVNAWNISQNPEVGGGEILASYVSKETNTVRGPKIFLNTHDTVVGPERVMEMTRLTHYVDESGNIHGGSEIVVQAAIWFMAANPGSFSNVEFKQSISDTWDDKQAFNTAIEQITRASAFRVKPHQYFGLTTSSGDTINQNILCELNNFTTIDVEQLQRIHDTAILSEFVVPNVNVSLK